MRFISHHDLMKVFERAVRRAEIPIEMSKGFNPHPKISITLALSVGIVGKDEVLELEVSEGMHPELLAEQLRRQLPQEINILSAEAIPHALKCSIRDVTYEVSIKDTCLLKTLNISEFLQQPVITVHRTKDGHRKPFDIRPSIQEITANDTGLRLVLKMTPVGLAKPEEVLRALWGNEENKLFEITRTKVNLSSTV